MTLPAPFRTFDDVALVALVGVRRQVYRYRHNLGSGAYLNGREPWAHEITAAGSELLVALEIDETWNAYVGDPRNEPADVGAEHEVRWVDGLEGRQSLIVRPDDEPGRTYWLVVGVGLADLRVVGSIGGVAARRGEWWTAPNGRNPAYFVPQSALDLW